MASSYRAFIPVIVGCKPLVSSSGSTLLSGKIILERALNKLSKQELPESLSEGVDDVVDFAKESMDDAVDFAEDKMDVAKDAVTDFVSGKLGKLWK